MTADNALLIALGLFALVGSGAAVYWWLNRTPSGYRRDRDAELPLFSVSMPDSRRTPPRPATPPAAAPVVPKSAGKAPETPVAVPAAAAPKPAKKSSEPNIIEISTATAAAPVATPVATPVAPPVATPVATPPAAAGVTNPAPTPEPVLAHGVPGSVVEGHLLRFSVPQEGTLQFLPGRLEVSGGLDAGREIRFVRVPGPDGTQVTFGRSEGPAYRHIQLREATVSRLHARLTLREGTWHLTNLSSTNPAVYNGRILNTGEEQPLSDGDRIEMGEVLFGFRSR